MGLLAGRRTLKLKLYFLASLYVSHVLAALGIVKSFRLGRIKIASIAIRLSSPPF